MTTVVKEKDALIVPVSVRKRAGIKAGDRLEFKVSGGVISIIPKLPSAEEDYTPAQRRAVDAQLADAGQGHYYGPFSSADEAVQFLRGAVRSQRAKSPRR
jgi:AbrB family looped-hinge helix DNA binding protein